MDKIDKLFEMLQEVESRAFYAANGNEKERTEEALKELAGEAKEALKLCHDIMNGK